MRKDSSAKGFTLLELTIVMLMLTVVCGLILPGYTGINNDYELEHAAVVMAQDIRLLQERAAARQDDGYNIYFGSQYYSLRLANDAGGYSTQQIIKKVSLSDGLKITERTFSQVASAGRNVLQINSGGAYQTGHIKLQNDKGSIYVVIAITGRVRVTKQL